MSQKSISRYDGTCTKLLVVTTVLIMVGAGLAGCLSNEKKKNKPPMAEITEVSSGGVNGTIFNIAESIYFDGNGSKDPEKKPLKFAWDFGDGSSADTIDTTHSYTAPGIFNVTLTVSDGKKTGTAYTLITINTPPVAIINLTTLNLPIDVPVKFNASDSYDDDGDTLSYSWDFGDNSTGIGVLVNHTYTVLGAFNVTLEVADYHTSTEVVKTLQIFQPNRPPAAVFTLEPTMFNNTETITFNATGSTDPDGDALTYSWDFGDNKTATGNITTHAYELSGSYTVNLTVSDGEIANRTSKVLGVLQKNRAPIAAFNISKEVGYIGLLFNFDASSSVDPDSDPMTYSWEFGDGMNATGIEVEHFYSSVGTYKVNLTVSDWEYDVVATGAVEILPSGKIFVEWDQTNYAYDIQLDGDMEMTHADLNITDETTSIKDDDYHISNPNATYVVHITSSIVPVPGHTLNITLTYKGRSIANRVIEVIGQTPVPKGNAVASYDTTMKRHTESAKGEGWMNITGTSAITYSDDRVNQSFTATSSEVWNEEVDGTERTVMMGTYPVTKFNNTNRYNVDEYTDNFLTQDLFMEIFDDTTWIGAVNMTGHQKVVNDLTTSVSSDWDGEMTFMGYRMNITTTMVDIGFEQHDNGDGETYDCIKVMTNQTIHGYIGMPPVLPLDHYAMVNESITWMVRDGTTYTDLDIYCEYNQSLFFINDSSAGRWEWLNSEEGQVYLDEDEDGDFNPSPAEVDVDKATEFRGVTPRELRVGDKVATRNEHNMVVTMVVEGKEEVTVSGKALKAVKVNVTYSGTDMAGSGMVLVVNEGIYTGLMLKTDETQEYTDANGEVQTKYAEIKIKTLT